MTISPFPYAVNSPCKDCAERFDLCHSVCPKYLEYKAYREYVRSKRLKSYRANPDLKAYKKKRKK